MHIMYTFLGLLAKIKCSICSYQFNIWYTGNAQYSILNEFFLGCFHQSVLAQWEHGWPRPSTTPRTSTPFLTPGAFRRRVISDRQITLLENRRLHLHQRMYLRRYSGFQACWAHRMSRRKLFMIRFVWVFCTFGNNGASVQILNNVV